MYIDKLANGVDPITDSEMEGDTVLNNVRLARTRQFILDNLTAMLQEEL